MYRLHMTVIILLIAIAVVFAPSARCDTKVLDGRIEAIVKPNATLPAPILKMQDPVIDTTRVTPTLQGNVTNPVLQGQAASADLHGSAASSELQGAVDKTKLRAVITNPAYPEYLLGKWGGTFKTTWVGQQQYYKELPTEFVLGSTGRAVFEFFKQGKLVRLKPSCVYYPSNNVSIEHFVKFGGKGERIDPEILKSKERKTFTRLDLNQSRIYHVDGTTTEMVAALKDLKIIRQGVVEQDLVVRKFHAKRFEGYRETVLRFVWRRKDLIFCQIGVVSYDAKGVIANRSIEEGWLTPNWKRTAGEISADYGLTWEKIENYGVPGTSNN